MAAAAKKKLVMKKVLQEAKKQQQQSPYNPSFPAIPARVGSPGTSTGVEEFQVQANPLASSSPHHHQAQAQQQPHQYHSKENTILDVLRDEVKERQAELEAVDAFEKAKFMEANLAKIKNENTGFWIFGAGYQQEMAEDFKNPDLVSQFVIRILVVMIYRICLRLIFLCLMLLYPPIHNRLFTEVVSVTPMIVSLSIYGSFLISSHHQGVFSWIRQRKLHHLLFFFSEITLAVVLCFIALCVEYGVIKWHATLDIFDDYNEEVKTDRHYWTKLMITPPVFIIIFDIQIIVNVAGALLLQMFTPYQIHLGSHELYRIQLWLTLFTMGMTYVAILTSSYGVVPIWDGLQAVCGCLGGLAKSWIFVYKIARLVDGKMIAVNTIEWEDVFYACYVLF